MKEYYCWVWQILKTQLNLKNKIISLNTIPASVLVYSFRIVNCLRKEIQKRERKMRKLLTIVGFHHPQADVS